MARGLNNNIIWGFSSFAFTRARAVRHALFPKSILQAERGNEIDTRPASDIELL